MANYKRRLDCIAGRIGADGPPVPDIFAGFIKWETEARAAAGGELPPAEAERIEAAFRVFMGRARTQGRRV